MNIEEFREYCLSLKGVHEKMPFPNVPDKYSQDVLCFYVASKWFCFVNIEVFDFCCINIVVKSLTKKEREALANFEE